MLLGGRQEVQAVLRRTRRPLRPVEAVEQRAAHLVLLQHHRDRFVLVQRRLSLASALGVGGEGLLQVLGQPQVVDDQAAGLVLEHAVHAGDGLHQPVAAHRLVDVHGVQAGRVEAGQPHVPHQHNPQRVAGVAEPLRQRLPPRLVADVRLPLQGVGGRAGHHHLDGSPYVIVIVPVGAQAHQLAVEGDADATAHAHDHRLAFERLQPSLEVGHDVLGDLLHPLLRPYDRLELRPPRLEPLPALHLLALGGLLELRVDPRLLAFVQGQLGQAALVVDRHGRPVLDGASDVVDADVVPEHGARVGVLELYGRAGEADERRQRQGVAHVAGVAVDEVVLAPVRLVGYHDDVPAVRQRRVGVALLLREELLNRGEHDAARLDRELSAQVGPALRLHRRLAQQVLAAGEGAEELVVQVVPVREHDDGGVLHRGLAHDGPGVEGHRQALAGALRVPHHPDASVARVPARLTSGLVVSLVHLGNALAPQLGRAEGLVDRDAHRV